ncbi:hypothetical protein K493DRAFT_342119 [Basidiobolus meristosporus CBS 931.73]|uniref:BSD domain-containing protein n=1 Tax=Basidiobolus meristosporus CBS 931.73 TaxID=1314790 RepID=A0A1Y1XB10_9FUNG|nr:hypothetical protein K493DRAFT_342119 [Basidiobolus meristosporus CBS 931.73]|eukprot:ORX82907.1 hypothetical protein K493DRAFT_342119 [Basidiobolus meristosporus CBS 931.73]
MMDDSFFYVLREANEESGTDPGESKGKQKEGEAEDSGLSLPSFSSFGWGGTLTKAIEKAKKQSEDVVNVYKKDISEFASVVAADTTQTFGSLTKKISDLKTTLQDEETSQNLPPALKTTSRLIGASTKTAEQFVSRWGSGLSKFISDAIVITPTEEEHLEEEEEDSSKKIIIMDRKEVQLSLIRLKEETYLSDPTTEENADAEDVEKFKQFSETFEVTDYTDEISELLKANPELQELMQQIVPTHVPYEKFWLRYYFRVFEIDEKEEKRKQLVNDAAVNNEEEELFNWDDDDDENENENDNDDADQAKSEAQESQEKSEDTEQKQDDTPHTSDKEEITAANDEDGVVPEESKSPQLSTGPNPRKSEESFELVQEGKSKSDAPKAKKEKPKQNEDGAEEDDWSDWE